MIRIDEEELERAIAIALSVTRDMYLRFATRDEPKDERAFNRQRAKEVIAYSVMRQLSRYAIYREPSAFELAKGRLGVLPLFPDQSASLDQDAESGSSSSG